MKFLTYISLFEASGIGEKYKMRSETIIMWQEKIPQTLKI